MVEGVKYWRKFSKKRAKNGRNSAIKLAILANFWCQNGEIGQKKSGNTDQNNKSPKMSRTLIESLITCKS